jgi:glycosyltransferase involved in cell wall biosynthesis
MNLPKLGMIPALKAQVLKPTEVVLTQKFLDGVKEYQKYWTGEIVVFLEADFQPSPNLDNVVVSPQKLPFQLEIVNLDTLHPDHLSLVLVSAGFRQNRISKICQSLDIPCVYITEYSFKTRLQIINATTSNPLLRLRRYLWEVSQERKQRQAIALAQGVQCNGTPTYNAYHNLNPHPLLYFDSRTTASMLATAAEINARTVPLLNNAPLRLLFSGRLTKIKGADHLLLVASQLQKLGMNFQLFICGDGDLQNSMQQQIQERGLENCVQMLGVLQFNTQLVPFVKSNIDLFLCCHRQGDPSCTYLETMSCGVPLIGYDNEAFAGLVEKSQVGWLVEMDRPEQMAKQIFTLNSQRQKLIEAAFRSLAFAELHTFEATFQTRIAHLKSLLRSSG